MKVELYINKSDDRHLYKDISKVAEVEVSLKSKTSILDPILQLKASVDYSANCNYLYIPQYDRFYFITNFSSVNKGLWEIACHVDVLSSNRVEILQQTCVVSRQENLYNLNLDDGTLKATSNPIVITKNFPKSIKDYNASGTPSAILVVAGGDK